MRGLAIICLVMLLSVIACDREPEWVVGQAVERDPCTYAEMPTGVLLNRGIYNVDDEIIEITQKVHIDGPNRYEENRYTTEDDIWQEVYIVGGFIYVRELDDFAEWTEWIVDEVSGPVEPNEGMRYSLPESFEGGFCGYSGTEPWEYLGEVELDDEIVNHFSSSEYEFWISLDGIIRESELHRIRDDVSMIVTTTYSELGESLTIEAPEAPWYVPIR